MERIEFVHGPRKSGEWWEVQIAINGALSIPFEMHESQKRRFSTWDEFIASLIRNARGYISTFGDARGKTHQSSQARSQVA